MTTLEIPLVQGPQTLIIDLGGANYRLTLLFADVDEGGWILDIADENGQVLAAGLPLVCSDDLLGQLAYLGIGGGLYAATDGKADAPPTFDALGVSGRLYFVQ